MALSQGTELNDQFLPIMSLQPQGFIVMDAMMLSLNATLLKKVEREFQLGVKMEVD
jgi:hypothetical protein